MGGKSSRIDGRRGAQSELQFSTSEPRLTSEPLDSQYFLIHAPKQLVTSPRSPRCAVYYMRSPVTLSVGYLRDGRALGAQQCIVRHQMLSTQEPRTIIRRFAEALGLPDSTQLLQTLGSIVQGQAIEYNRLSTDSIPSGTRRHLNPARHRQSHDLTHCTQSAIRWKP